MRLVLLLRSSPVRRVFFSILLQAIADGRRLIFHRVRRRRLVCLLLTRNGWPKEKKGRVHQRGMACRRPLAFFSLLFGYTFVVSCCSETGEARAEIERDEE